MTNEEIKMLLMSRLEKKASMDKEAGPFSPRYIKNYKEGARQVAIAATEAAQPLVSKLKSLFIKTKPNIDIPIIPKTVVDNDLITSVAKQRASAARQAYNRAKESILDSPLYYRSKAQDFPSPTHRMYMNVLDDHLKDIPEALANARIPHSDYRNFQKLLSADSVYRKANRMINIPGIYMPNTGSVFDSVEDASKALNKHLEYLKK